MPFLQQMERLLQMERPQKARHRFRCRSLFAPALFLCALTLGGPVVVSAAEATDISPGVNRIDRLVNHALDELFESANAPIFSPDGNHLYFSRLRNLELAAIVALAFDSDGQPELASSVSTATPGFEAFTSFHLRAFNAAGTRAYATATLEDQSALVVLERDPQNGQLSFLQLLGYGENEQANSLQVSADFEHLYVAVPTIIGFNTTAGKIIRYVIGDDGRLVDAQSVVLDAASAAHELRLLDGEQRLLVSTDTTVTEYGIEPTDAVLSAALQVTDLPILPPRGEDPAGPGPMDLVVTSNGEFVFGVLDEDPSVGGGYINAWSRDPLTGALQLVDQVFPAGFERIENFLWDPYPAVLTPDEDILLLPSFWGRFFAGSPSVVGCVNAFAIGDGTGKLRVMGNDCSGNSGRGLAQHPQNERFYSIFHGLRPFTIAPPPIAAIGVFEPGRILGSTNIHAAVLPTSRTLANRETNPEPVTYFSSVLNAGDEVAEFCTITAPDNQPYNLRYQVTDPATDEPLDPDSFAETFSVPANGVQTLLISMFANAEFTPTNVALEYQCLNTPVAPKVSGVNSLLMSASNQSLADLITATATIGNNGITRLPSTAGRSAFAVSTINIGGEDEIRAVAVLDFANFVAELEPAGGTPDLRTEICETNAETGECLAPPSDEVVRRIATDEIVTYTVFVTGRGSEVAFSPAVNRAFIVLLDSAGEVRGASSVAVTTQP